MTYSVLDDQKSIKKNFSTFKAEENQEPFKDLHRNLRTLQGEMKFKDFSRTLPKIQRPLSFRKDALLCFFCKIWYVKSVVGHLKANFV